jgi:hypothetical protein
MTYDQFGTTYGTYAKIPAIAYNSLTFALPRSVDHDEQPRYETYLPSARAGAGRGAKARPRAD